MIILRSSQQLHHTYQWHYSNTIVDKIFCARNNAEDIVQVRAEGFKVGNNNNNGPAPENIPAGPTLVKEVDKKNCLSLDQEWGWDSTCNRQKGGHHHISAKVNNHNKQDLIDLGFLEVFWLMLPQFYFYLTIIKHTSNALKEEGRNKWLQGEFPCFLGCNFFMACTFAFSMLEGACCKCIDILIMFLLLFLFNY